MSRRPLRIVILGMMGRNPFGGQTWLYLNWLLALHRLGHEVWYVEDDIVWFYDPRQNRITDDCHYAVEHIAGVLQQIGLPERWALRFQIRDGACWGLSPAELAALYRSCDVLLNICGATELREDHFLAPYRVYVETDPVVAELRFANGDKQIQSAFYEHHIIATYGENYGSPDCSVPLPEGFTFLKTRQPVDLGYWPPSYRPEARCFTTIGNFRQRKRDLTWRGETYHWSKHHEWQKFLHLPLHTGQDLELALEAGPSDLALLAANGWSVVRPIPMSLDPFGAYRDFIGRSRGEFTVAKDMNIRLRSGWFSERDACYLASAKPVVTQDTGFTNVLPTGKGLFAVSNVDDAADAFEAINKDYSSHSDAARMLAEDYFDGPAVAHRLLVDLGLVPS